MSTTRILEQHSCLFFSDFQKVSSFPSSMLKVEWTLPECFGRDYMKKFMYASEEKINRTSFQFLLICPMKGRLLNPEFHYEFNNWKMFPHNIFQSDISVLFKVVRTSSSNELSSWLDKSAKCLRSLTFLILDLEEESMSVQSSIIKQSHPLHRSFSADYRSIMVIFQRENRSL